MSNRTAVPGLSRLSLKHFKGFRISEDIRLAPLTFLVGPNSAGKSSLADAILLIAQSPFVPLSQRSFTPTWIGDLVDLGSFRDCVYAHDVKRTMSIGLEIDNLSRDPIANPHSGDVSPVRLDYSLRCTAANDIGFVSQLRITDIKSGCAVAYNYRPRAAKRLWVEIDGRVVPISGDRSLDDYDWAQLLIQMVRALAKQKSKGRGGSVGWHRLARFIDSPSFVFFIKQTQRVSSGRAGPLRWYPVQAEVRLRSPFDESISLFDRIQPSMLSRSEPRSFFRRRPPRKAELIDVLRELDIASDIAADSLSAYHSNISVIDNVTKVKSNLADVGYGASQVLPVAAGCLNYSTGPLFVEQPEIHLHPRAQAKIADLLAKTSTSRQVIVETHSEHMINRARILVAEGKLPHHHVAINYVFRDKRGSHVKFIPLQVDGEFGADWPNGFFDERYHDTMRLMKLRKIKGDAHADRAR